MQVILEQDASIMNILVDGQLKCWFIAFWIYQQPILVTGSRRKKLKVFCRAAMLLASTCTCAVSVV